MSTIESKQNPAHVVSDPETILIPALDKTGNTPVSLTPTQLGIPLYDNEGNLLGHVSPRIDTLANLLTVSDAGDGEVATASDTDALVVYKGSPSFAVAYRRSDNAGKFLVSLDIQQVPAAGIFQMALMATIVDDLSLVDVVNDTFTVPIVTKRGSIDRVALPHFNIDAYGLAPSNATYFEFELQSFNGAWVSYTIPIIFRIPHFPGTIPRLRGFFMTQNITATEGIRDQRIIISHDDSALVFLLGSLSGDFVNFFDGYGL